MNEMNYRKQAEQYRKTYGPLLESIESSPLAQVRSINESDYYALGRQFDRIGDYQRYLNESGTVTDLGKVPELAYDIIAVSYGASIIPIISSVQDIDDERGIVYFKNIKAVNDRGTVSAGDSLRDPRSAPDAYPSGYASEIISRERVGNPATATADVTDSDYAYDSSGALNALAKLPVRPRTVRIEIVEYNVAVTPATRTVRYVATDDGNGNLIGVNVQGSIDYATGEYTFNVFSLGVDADTGTQPPSPWYDSVGAADLIYKVEFTYGTDFEESGDIPQITTFLDSTDIKADIHVLGQELGIFKAYGLNRRFGLMAEDDMIQDLSQELSKEISNTLIRRMWEDSFTVPFNETTFDQDNYSDPTNSQGWSDGSINLLKAINEAEQKIYTNLGRGNINVILASPSICSALDVTPGFVRAGMSYPGPHVYGTLQGNIIVIRVPSNIIPQDNALLLYRGTGYFDAPSVYASYMPMFITNTLPVPDNVLKTQGLAATWAGTESVVPRMTTRLRFTT